MPAPQPCPQARSHTRPHARFHPRPMEKHAAFLATHVTPYLLARTASADLRTTVQAPLSMAAASRLRSPGTRLRSRRSEAPPETPYGTSDDKRFRKWNFQRFRRAVSDKLGVFSFGEPSSASLDRSFAGADRDPLLTMSLKVSWLCMPTCYCDRSDLKTKEMPIVPSFRSSPWCNSLLSRFNCFKVFLIRILARCKSHLDRWRP